MAVDSYIICTSPRSGSTLLGRMLSQTGVAGKPESYFHEPSIKSWLGTYNLPDESLASERECLASVFRAVIAEGSQGTGVFGLRLQRHSFDFFISKLAVLYPEFSSDKQRFGGAFGRTAFIHLTRTDKIDQAISYVKAEQSGLWHMGSDGAELERLAPPQVPTYHALKIQHQIERFETFDREWNSWFEMEQVDPLRLTYESLSADPQETLRAVLEYIGVNPEAAKNVVPDVTKLADTSSRQWADRFRKEHNLGSR